MLRTIFFGTPEFALPTLVAMLDAGYAPLRVVSQPARPLGRGRRLQDPPVAHWARRHGLEVRQPETVRETRFVAELRALEPDVAVVVAFGQIFRRELLELPRLGSINVHASLLPRYRGAAPIQAALAHGEHRTGVTIMQMEEGLDSGPILLQEAVEIAPDETAGQLAERLARLGGELLVETLRRLELGTLEPRPQDDTRATYAPRLKKADGVVDWRREARAIFDQLRAYTPWPGVVGELRGKPLKLVAARPLADETSSLPPGSVVGLREDRLVVVCGGGTLLGLERVQRPGKNAVSAAAFVHGEHLAADERFTVAETARDTPDRESPTESSPHE